MIGQATQRIVLAIATNAGPSDVLAWIIGMGGIAAGIAWAFLRFGPTISRSCGAAFWWIGWMCGIAGGYVYTAVFVVAGTALWSAGTIWYASRQGHWPSPLGRRLNERCHGLFGTVVAPLTITRRHSRRRGR